MALGWAAIASIIYFSLYFIIIVGVAFYTHFTGEYENKKSFFKAVWDRKGIYLQILIHLYDTATDVGVLVGWWLLVQKEKDANKNVESLNMAVLFWTSIAFLIVYRIISIIIAMYDANETAYQTGKPPLPLCCLNIFLALVDMYIIQAIYKAIKGEQEKPSPKQKVIQLCEAMAESLPQVVLQSVFIMRGYNDPVLRNDNTIYLVGFSLLASMLSITNKFIWLDEECVVEDAQQPQLSKKQPFINKWYLLRSIWRFSLLLTRFAAVTSLWVVLGGWFWGIYLGISLLVWSTITVYLKYIEDKDDSDFYFLDHVVIPLVLGIACLAAVPGVQSYLYAFTHALDMVILMSIVTIFSFNTIIDCSICADPMQRQATHNPYILSFIVVGWCSMVVDFVTYGVMLHYKRFEDDLANVIRPFENTIEDEN
eukprot:461993_1